jgi:importin subunit beta-1
MDITSLLVNAQSPDPGVRSQAEAAIQALQEGEQYAGFWVACAGELANNEKALEVRQLAGLILKNALDAKDELRCQYLQKRWIELPAEVKAQVKHFLLTTLTSPAKTAGHTSAQVIAKVAAIELPLKAWPEMLGLLKQLMDAPTARQATLEALGYMCEDLEPEHLEQGEIDVVLTAIVHGIRTEEPDTEVRLAAINALLNALDFAESNFEKDNERSYIVQITVEATQCAADVRIRQAAFECLVHMHQAYYKHMAAYISEVFQISVRAIREDEEEVALQAVELWTTLAELELEEGEATNKYLVKQALPMLVPEYE